MKAGRVAVLCLVLVALMIGAHYAGLFEQVENWLIPPIEDAQEAGERAAQEVTDEMDQETDAEVAADSAVADEHDAERREFDRDAAGDESAAVDDLDRRLRSDLRDGLRDRTDPGAGEAGSAVRGRADEGGGK